MFVPDCDSDAFAVAAADLAECVEHWPRAAEAARGWSRTRLRPYQAATARVSGRHR